MYKRISTINFRLEGREFQITVDIYGDNLKWSFVEIMDDGFIDDDPDDVELTEAVKIVGQY